MKTSAEKQPETREDRVAAALRENLRKRKIQAQAKQVQEKDQECP